LLASFHKFKLKLIRRTPNSSTTALQNSES